MNSRNIATFQSTGDADTLLVSTAIAACSSHNIAVIGEDTDILILLIHHYVNDIFFMRDKNVKDKKVWKIKEVNNQLPDKIVDCILPIRAFLGCYTVSRVHSIGTGEESFKKIMSNPEILNNLFKFNGQDTDKTIIATAGEKLLSIFYVGSGDEKLNDMRYDMFCKKVTVSKSANTHESLPPTSDAACIHSFRAYHQVQIWRGSNVDPFTWGWKVLNGMMIPIPMQQAPAPNELLKIFRCDCKVGCKNVRCTCVKNELKRTQVCDECRGVSCINSQESILNSDEDELIVVFCFL